MLNKILIVENEGLTALELQKTLRIEGYDVPSIASSGEEAIEKAVQIKPDLVLMDIMLNGPINGIEAAEKIKKMIDIPIIYLTAYGDEETFQKAKITEPHAYILKPFERKEIKNAIEISLHKHKMELKLKNSLIKKEMLIKEISSNLQNNYNKITNLINSGFTESINKNIGLKQEIEQNKRDNNDLGIFQDDFAFVDFAQYVESLVKDLKGSYNLDPAVDINLNIENIMLDLDTSLSYGLIINELLKSSINNLHFNKKVCSINIDFHLDNNKFILTINDNYNNYPELMEAKNSSSKLISTLVKQQHGTIGFNENKKSEIKVIFGIRS